MLRFIFITITLAVVTIVLLPIQALQIMLGSPGSAWLPVLYHRVVCAMLGIRIRVVGAPTRRAPVLVVSNHCSWLDIPVITALTPVAFVSKNEVADWPIFGLLAKLQRSVFIDRHRRQKTAQAIDDIAERLREGSPVVLFAEGTSSDGNRVLPFRSALLGAAREAVEHVGPVMVQPLSIAYVGLHGLPLGRQHRSQVAWYGSTDLLPHLMHIIRSGGIDVVLSWGAPVPNNAYADRKQLAVAMETAVRHMTITALRGAAPSLPQRRPVLAKVFRIGKRRTAPLDIPDWRVKDAA